MDGAAQNFSDRHDPFVIFNIFWFVPIALVISLFDLNWLQILISPKVFLVEYAAGTSK